MEEKKLKKKRYAISCTEVPEALLQKTNALNYFNKFGRIVKLTFRLKSKSCIVDYDCEDSVFNAIDNGGYYEENYFTVRPYFYKKPKKLSESKDPDWPNDPELQEELNALAEIVPHQHVFRSPISKEIKQESKKEKIVKSETKIKKSSIGKPIKKSSVKMEIKKKPIDSAELDRLIGIIKQVAHTTEDKYKILDARDKLIRLHSSRQTDIGNDEKIIGTCPDMCPEKERYLRESQHQVSLYEQCNDEHGDYRINHKTAIKQYSRSSADQEMPLPHELRPVSVLQYTMNHLLRNIIDLCDAPDINIADWYHFVWDRTRGIRKDITQQQLCCRGSVELVEQCARFHIHCAARLISEDVSVFDPKINTENLTKCLQTLKYMYHDLALKNIYCPNEAEFRGYIILLNLHDGNFMWEVKQLRREIQKSAEVNFAIKVFLALDNNNFVSFFKLVRQTTYLNACILLRYFNEIRSRTLNRMIRTHSPRATKTQMPLNELEHLLAFENRTSLIAFIDYHQLQLNETGTHVILNRKAFTTSSSYELDRAVNVVESKRHISVSQIVSGSEIELIQEFCNHTPQNSFDEKGYFKKSEIQEQWLNQKKIVDKSQNKGTNTFEKSSESTNVFHKTTIDVKPTSNVDVKTSSSIFEKLVEKKSSSIFTKPIEMKTSSIFEKNTELQGSSNNIFEKSIESVNIFEKPSTTSSNIFTKPIEIKTSNSSIFDKSSEMKTSTNIFEKPVQSNIFNKSLDVNTTTNIFNKPIEIKSTLFEKSNEINKSILHSEVKKTGSIFDNKIESNSFIFKKPIEISTPNYTQLESDNESSIVFTKPSNVVFKSTESTKSMQIFNTLNNKAIVHNEFNDSRDYVDRGINLKRNTNIFEFDTDAEALKPIIFQPYNKKRPNNSNIFENTLLSRQPSQVDIDYEKRKFELEKPHESLKKAEEERLKLKKEAEARKRAEEEELKRKQELERIRIANEEEQKRKKELETKAEMELREKLLEQVKIKREQKQRELVAGALLNELIDAIEIHETQQRLKQIGNNIKLWKIKYIVEKWRNKISNIRRKRKAVEDSPVWIAKRSYIDEANELYTSNQNLTLINMKQYKLRNQMNLVKKDETIVKINFNKNIFQHLKNSIEQFENTIVNTFYWKILLNFPDENESDVHTNKFLKALENTFSLKKRNDLLMIDSITPNNSDILNICIQSVIGDFLFDKNEKFDIILFGINDSTMLQKMKKRLETILKPQSIVIILRNGLTPQSKTEIIKILQLEQFVTKKMIKNYQIYIDNNYSIQEFIHSIEMGLCFLANNIEPVPPLHMNQISNFLHVTIGNEFAQRLKDSAKTNVALQLSFNDCMTVINLYNQAVIVLTNLVLNDTNFNYPNFPNEFSEYLPTTFNYPCTYEYFPKYWKDEKFINCIENYLNMLYLPQLNIEKWPPKNISELEDILHNYCKQIVDSKHLDVIFLKILSFTLDFIERDTSDNFQIRIQNFPWVDMLQIFISYKINCILNVNSQYQKIVIYNRNNLKFYNSVAWWLESEVIHNKIEQLTDMLHEKNEESLLACETQAFEEEPTNTIDDFDINAKLSQITMYDYDREIQLIQKKQGITEFKSLLDDLNSSIQIQKLAMDKFCGIIERELRK